MGSPTMGKWRWAVAALPCLLAGCATTGAGGAVPPQLFDADAHARFSFYFSCVSKTVNCEIVERQFDAWATMHHVTMHTVARDDPAFSAGKPSQPTEQAVPYRLAVRYSPEMAPSQNSLAGTGGTGLPMVSYAGTAQIFDSTSGSLLKTQSYHDQKMADQDHGAANPYLQAQVEAFLGHLDPAYAKARPSS
ncbi:hypothetical protein [Dyella sp. C9]|uniref:hypothetical protein n=1 Tax=Dyella sp. C9 TaxID=2202154 RepID=UPI000DEECFB3|nr:hypothetical protein [Dyella sp. C9]